ncbi:MAG: hypothetical protein JST35_07460 [Armatimonadetes bacterium]|nr:hypothetical protein [Armatimonadota bacterium]
MEVPVSTRKRLPKSLIDLTQLREVNLAGRGGHERGISILLPRWRRVNAPLHDFETTVQGKTLRLEVKSQSNIQWFDIRKFHALSRQERLTRIMFLIHSDEVIDRIEVTTLGELLDWMLLNRQSDGWTEEVIRLGAELRHKYPSMQFKARANILSIITEAPELFDTIFSK